MKATFLAFAAVAAAQQALVGSDAVIEGHEAKNAGVTEWLGIPYAQPPLANCDSRRPGSTPPTVFRSPRNMYDITYPCNNCMYSVSKLVDYPDKTAQFDSIFEAFGAINNDTQSEDCLTLNVWSKKSTQLKPVYVHFHGGRWTNGATNTPFYYGGDFADAEDVIVVTANYRMNIFGFPGLPNNPPNLGLMDQRLAVEWVKANIKGFGGDPDRIVISGQSCGSASVDYWAFAHETDPLVAGIISHSGTALSFPTNNQTTASEHWYTVSEKLGCGSSGDVLPCMREQTATDVLTAASSVKVPVTNPARKAPAFQPTVDGSTVFEDYTLLSEQGRFARIPYLVGHGANEAGFYKVSSYAQGSILTDEAWDNFNMQTFFCPSNLEAEHRADRGTPVWRFQYNADWDNTRLYPTSGAYHGVEFNMIFGESAEITGIPESDVQLQLQAKMRSAWAAFIANPQSGLTTLGWPTYDSEGSTLAEIGLNNVAGMSYVSTKDTAERCAALMAEI
ncbi:CAZyme family CE10 [Penicillium paradoxum]|uniref:CAZyme family CE10 n=1 Tax=Penicillium paradoxum TaxID=176176 RepID=UPI002547E6FA|nr:CAZyme family CE10 [Penicillium paradoxum]KAJ5773031.1 CAZyme family CE10 [Penicillium paradoxum]